MSTEPRIDQLTFSGQDRRPARRVAGGPATGAVDAGHDVSFTTQLVSHRHASTAVGIGPVLLLTVEEAASLLRIGRTRCFQLVMAGRIRSIKVGRRRLVLRAGLKEFVAELSAEQTMT